MKRPISLLLSLSLLLALCACGGPAADSQPPESAPVQTAEPSAPPSGEAPEPPAPVLTLNAQSVALSSPSDAFQLEAAVDSGEIAALSFSCEDETVAAVTDGGLVTGLKPGSTAVSVQAAIVDERGTHEVSVRCPVSCLWEEPSAPPSQVPAPSSPPDGRSVTLSHNDVTLKAAGNYFVLSVVRHAIPEDAAMDVKYVSSDEGVAAVSDKGVVTAVAPGRAIITVTATAMVDGSSRAWTRSCVVRCRWDAPAQPSGAPSEAPSAAPSQEPGPGPSAPPIFPGGIVMPSQAPAETDAPEQEQVVPVEPAPAGSVDLKAFYDRIYADYAAREEIPALGQVSDELLLGGYPGLASTPCYQRLVYQPGMTGVACEMVLVQVEDSADAAAVRAILQSRIDRQVGGGAWYPASIEQWENNSRIAVHGGYLLLVVHPDADAIVSAFDALF